MTQVQLTCGAERKTLDFDAKAQSWRRQNGEFLVGYNTGLPPPFARVFIKRLEAKPTGHDFLVASTGRNMPGLPCFYGYAADGAHHYYVSECLPPSFTLLEDLLYSRGPRAPSEVMTESFIAAAVDQTAATFEALLKQQVVYTDFSAKNMLVDEDGLVRFIDVDSVWPLAKLQSSRHPGGTEFDVKLWALWNLEIASASSGGEARAPLTLMLSFAAIWLRALALKQSGDANAALALLKDPGAAEQTPLWNALAGADRQAFAYYFRLAQADTAYDQWKQAFTALQNNAAVSFGDIRAATATLSAAIRTGASKAAAPARLQPKTAPATAGASLSQIDYRSRLLPTALAEAVVIGLMALIVVFLGAVVEGVPAFIFGLLPTPDGVNREFGLFSILLLPVFVVMLLAAGLISAIIGIGVFFFGVAALLALGLAALAVFFNFFNQPADYFDPIAYTRRRLQQSVDRHIIPYYRRGVAFVSSWIK